MGTWNTGPFDNDDAVELLEDLRDGDLDLDMILPDPTETYIEADQGAMIIAAAHLVAGSQHPEGVTDKQLAPLRTPEFREKLRQSLDAVLLDSSVSELHELWSDSDQFDEWKAKSWVDLS